ncbi:hypothetical protein KIH74_14315 [Kineosporia sp. J2-2]|uniref:Uncharacterized protein n=1 Tax=Kineosporia corallincola TaxID=2835133 RepID=A0ABS5TGD6_9ACTN|nr:hypothetical protein [Kineosporia corallincola]MBT0770110.1 hypothetical protein [Kineosporia corallincola]
MKRAAALLGAPVALVLLAGCGGASGTVTVDGTAGPAGVAGAQTTTPAAGSTGSSSSTSSPASTKTTTTDDGEGCAATGDAVPDQAGTALAGDLDGDGARDQIWLADEDDERYLGVHTASGATFSTTFESASPIAASAVGDTLSDGTAVILLDTGRSAALYTVVGCEIVATTNVKGEQYTFDEGFTGYGTGVGCPTVKDQKILAGYNVGDQHDDGFTVLRTKIELSDGGRSATNGAETDTGIWMTDSKQITAARSVTCGVSKTAKESGRVS